MRVIYKEIVNEKLTDEALEIVNNISKSSKRHQLKEHFNDTLDVYYSEIGEISYFVKTQEVKEGIELTISKVFL